MSQTVAIRDTKSSRFPAVHSPCSALGPLGQCHCYCHHYTLYIHLIPFLYYCLIFIYNIYIYINIINSDILIFLSFLISACRCGILNSRSVPPVNAPASVLPTFCEQTSIPRPWQQSVSDGSGQINGTGIPKPEMRWNDMNMCETSWNESLLRFLGVLGYGGYGWFNGSIFLPQKKTMVLPDQHAHLNRLAQGGHPQGRRANHHVHLTWQKPKEFDKSMSQLMSI